MEITQELHVLAKFTTTDAPVVSVYLNTQWRDQHQRERALTFLRRHIGQAQMVEMEPATARLSLEQDLARLAQWGEHLLRGSVAIHTPGVALFACSHHDLWIEFPAPVPFEDEFTIADRPALRQLARLHDDYTDALVVLVDSRSARICEVAFGGLLSEVDVTSEVPGRHKQGGWAQMRYQRHVKAQMDRHHQDVAAYVTSYLTANPRALLIISGQEEIVANLRHFLPTQVQQHSIDAAPLDIRTSQADIVQVAQDVIQRHEREEEQATLHRLLNRAGHGGLAVLGMQATLAAANAGQVHLLIMHRDLTWPGWRCQDCGTLGESLPPACPACGGGKFAAVELGEALVSQCLQTDAFIELIEPDTRLATYEGVGALLRYH